MGVISPGEYFSDFRTGPESLTAEEADSTLGGQEGMLDKQAFRETVAEVCDRLETQVGAGLSSEEAAACQLIV